MGVWFVILGTVSFGLGYACMDENIIASSSLLVISCILMIGAIIIDILRTMVKESVKNTSRA